MMSRNSKELESRELNDCFLNWGSQMISQRSWSSLGETFVLHFDYIS